MISCANSSIRAPALFSSGYLPAFETISNREHSSAAARACAFSSEVPPIFRAGTLMMRRSRRSSAGLHMTHRYASISFTSARSKNFTPPTILYGTPLRLKAYSKALDWAFIRYKMALSFQFAPRL